jgi:hypothetical protein
MSQRARAVVPWTWARMLRDQGPKSRDFICAMHTLRTWMDDNGFAYPNLRTWAAGARMSTNTLTKHYKAALREGWLGVERNPQGGQSWKRNSYRAAVPAHIKLPEKDEQLSDVLLSEFGDIEDHEEESCVTQSETPTTQTCITQDETPSATSCLTYTETPFAETLAANAEGVSNGHMKVSHQTPEGVSLYPPRCLKGVSLESRNPLPALETRPEVSEVLEVLEVSKREGTALTRSPRVGETLNGKPKELEASNGKDPERIRKVIKHFLAEGYSDQQIVIVAKVSIEEVQQMRRQQPT